LGRGEREKGRRARGTYSWLLEGLMTRGVSGPSGGNGRQFWFPGREREMEKKELIGGSRSAVRERERVRGWAGFQAAAGLLPGLGPGCGPVRLCPSPFSFFCSISFFLFFDFLF
jgi:hypothetical protein